MTRAWDEVDEDLQGEVDVITIVTDRLNMVREKIQVAYTHAMMRNRKVTVMYQNENNGSSATPAYWTNGWLTEKQCLQDAITCWSDRYDERLNDLKHG